MGTPVERWQGSMGLPFHSRHWAKRPEGNIWLQRADEYDHDHGDDYGFGFDFGFDRDSTADQSGYRLGLGRINY